MPGLLSTKSHSGLWAWLVEWVALGQPRRFEMFDLSDALDFCPQVWSYGHFFWKQSDVTGLSSVSKVLWSFVGVAEVLCAVNVLRHDFIQVINPQGPPNTVQEGILFYPRKIYTSYKNCIRELHQGVSKAGRP